jgi:hypothetical protein
MNGIGAHLSTIAGVNHDAAQSESKAARGTATVPFVKRI